MEQKRIDPKIISLIVIVLIAMAAGTVYLTGNKGADGTQSSSQEMAGTTSTTTTADTPATTASSSSYKDGEYTETGSYTTPGGSESITVTVTLSNGTVTAVDASGSARGGDAAQYQATFLSGYKSSVVGKSIDSVSLSRVAGSSLTSGGFNRALAAIKSDAAS